jgi:hypothetical protein
MIESLFILTTPDRLLRQHRPSHLVRSAQIRRTNGAKRHLSDGNPGQILWRDLETADLNPRTGASVTVKDTANRALSP